MTSTVTVTNIPNFDPQAHESLLQAARAQGVSQIQVDNLLLETLGSGRVFGQAAEQVSRQRPQLAPPNGADIGRIAEFGVLPSPGALVMSLVTKYAGEQREQNRQIRHEMTEQIVASMQEQADKMREMAAIQLAMGIASGAITIASGVLQVGTAVVAFKVGAVPDGATEAQKSAIDAKVSVINSTSQGVGQAAGGVAGIAKSIGDFYGTIYQAKIKEMDADQEKLRDMRDALKDLDEGLKELIQKALAAQDSIQQTQNQARTKILG
jgi:hypothetical protein